MKPGTGNDVLFSLVPSLFRVNSHESTLSSTWLLLHFHRHSSEFLFSWQKFSSFLEKISTLRGKVLILSLNVITVC